MEEVIPFDVIPAPDARLPLQVGQYYQFAGKPEEFTRLAELAYNQEPENPEVVGAYVSLLQRDNRLQEALKVLQDWQALNPEDTEARTKIEEIKKEIKQADSLSTIQSGQSGVESN